MIEIVLLCQYGASTGMLADAMLDEANERGLEVNINAFSEYEIEEVLDSKHPDIVLLGPQIRYKKAEFEEEYGDQVEFVIIDTVDYGTKNGKKVLDMALSHINK